MKYFVASDIHGDSYWAQRVTDAFLSSGADKLVLLGDILYQNQALILAFHKGDLKADVSVGVGIDRMLLDNERLVWEREIQEQLELDGQKVKYVEITDTEIRINASY